jgi:transcriptional regulator with XRE-family HTH domain
MHSKKTWSPGLTASVAERLRSLRMAAGLSLEALATASGVSRSMISAIERAEVNATAVVLDRLASALDLSLTQLLDASTGTDAADADADANTGPVSRKAAQAVWRDPGSGYERRSLSPAKPAMSLRLVEVKFPGKARVAYESTGKGDAIAQQLWMLSGSMVVILDGQRHELHAGDCLAMRVNQPIIFHNPQAQAARYLVAQA